MSATPTHLPFATVSRVILAGMLGALVGAYGVPVGDALVAISVLLVAPLLSLWLDSSVLYKRAVVVPLALGLLAVLVLLGGFGALVAFPHETDVMLGSVASFYLAAAVLLVPGVAAFSLGREDVDGRPAIGQAVLCALAAWLGFGLRNFIQSILTGQFSSSNGNDFAGVLLYFAIGLYVIGVGLSAVEGMLGIMLRGWLVRRAGRPRDEARFAKHG